MIHLPKYQFSRKPKKTQSREKQLAFGSRNPASRLKTKESEERNPSIDNGNSNNKPHQPLSNFKRELIQQGAKFINKDIDLPSQEIRQIIENRGGSPVYVKKGVTSKIKDVKQATSNEKILNRVNSKDGNLMENNKDTRILNQITQLRETVCNLQIKNKQLQQKNEQLVQRLKRQNQTKQRQRPSQQKELLQTDRTVNYQKQLREKKQEIDSLNENIISLSLQNQKLTAQTTQLKQESLNIINQKNNEIQNLKDSIASKIYVVEETKKKLDKAQQENSIIRLQLERQRISNIELKQKAEVNLKNMLNLKKSNAQLLEKKEKYGQKISKESNLTNSTQSVKELNKIIMMLQKSLQNQLSDIKFLQNELQKSKMLKQINQSQAKLLEELSLQIIRANIISLNERYVN